MSQFNIAAYGAAPVPNESPLIPYPRRMTPQQWPVPPARPSESKALRDLAEATASTPKEAPFGARWDMRTLVGKLMSLRLHPDLPLAAVAELDEIIGHTIAMTNREDAK